MSFLGRLSDHVYLRSLPENCTFTVTQLESTINEEWYSTLVTHQNLPCVVTPGAEGYGLIASSTMETQGVFGHGSAPPTKVHFTISCIIENKHVENHGTIMFSTTEWTRAERADHSILTFGFDGDELKQLTQRIAKFGSPHPYSLGFGIKDNKIVMAGAIEPDWVSDFMSTLANGLVGAHATAIEWVMKAL